MDETLPLQPGSRFRGLLIHSRLGAGGMGTAYLASHPVLRTPLVVKIFQHTPEQDIFREAHLAARVTSPYTTPVLDAGVVDNVPYIVQSYVDGLDVHELWTRLAAMHRGLPLSLIMRILIHAATGLHAIHQAGVIHRDVKPANLFLRGTGTVTVGDFGIATTAKQSADVSGTVPFMAPEQIFGEPLDRTTDLYALGITAHLLLTGSLPFDSIEEKMQDPYVPPQTANPQAAYLFAVIERMLRRVPHERYPTAQMVANDIARIAQPDASYVRLDTHVFRVGRVRVELVVGNLAQTRADVLVSASNWALVMDMGVSLALLKAGGKVIEQEAVAQAPAAMGDVVWTQAGALHARYVAHAVAALEGAICIQRCVLRVLLGCEKRQVQTVAFPALGSGAGEVPMEQAAQLTLDAIKTFAHLSPQYVQSITIVLADQQAYESWLESAVSL